MLCKNVPQLIIQIYVIQYEKQWTPLQVLSVSASAAAVLFGLCVRTIKYLLREQPLTKTADGGGVGAAQELANRSISPPSFGGSRHVMPASPSAVQIVQQPHNITMHMAPQAMPVPGQYGYGQSPGAVYSPPGSTLAGGRRAFPQHMLVACV
jgi:hypothetical protein